MLPYAYEHALCIPVPVRRGAFRRARVAVQRGLEPPQGDAARPRPGGRVVPGRRPPAQTGNISRESLMTVPFFGNFDDMSVCGTNLVESIPNRAQLLADAIPAESYATGRNPVPGWGLLGGSTANVDMIRYKTIESDRWIHGYLKDVAFFHISGLFDDVSLRMSWR